MNIRELINKIDDIQLTEVTSRPVIVVDIQPAYGPTGCDRIIDDFVDFINRSNSKILYFYNGAEDSGLTEDSQQDVVYYLLDNGLEEDKLDNIVKFKDKGYGFLRDWMDNGIDDSTIIRTLRYMYQHRINDSREIPEEVFTDITDNQIEDQESMIIYVPDISISELRSFNNSVIVGGGRSECLRELQLIMNSFNIKYKEIQELIY